MRTTQIPVAAALVLASAVGPHISTRRPSLAPNPPTLGREGAARMNRGVRHRMEGEP